MATQSYLNFKQSQSRDRRPSNPPEFKVGYFTSLVEDGDTAAVRFDYDVPDEFQDVTVHTVQVQNRFRSVSCLKPHFYDPDSMCPLCREKNKVRHKTFLRMLVYSKGEDGQVTYKAVTWERPSMIVQDILNAVQEGIEDEKYPAGTPIRNMMFKIKRIGKKGDRGTTYRITALNPAAYPEEIFKADFSAFKDFDETKHSYMVRSAADVEEFLQTGNFPIPTRPSAEPAKAPAPKPAVETPAPKPVESPIAAPITDDEDDDLGFGVTQPAAPQPAPAPTRTAINPTPARTTSTDQVDPTARPKRTYTF